MCQLSWPLSLLIFIATGYAQADDKVEVAKARAKAALALLKLKEPAKAVTEPMADCCVPLAKAIERAKAAGVPVLAWVGVENCGGRSKEFSEAVNACVPDWNGDKTPKLVLLHQGAAVFWPISEINADQVRAEIRRRAYLPKGK